VTHFPISALKNEGKYYYLLTNLLIQCSEKGFSFLHGIPVAVRMYYGMVRSLPSSIKKEIEIKSFVSELIIKIINGSLSCSELNSVLEKLGYTFSPPLGPIECKSILENIMVEEFANSNPGSFINKPSKRKCVGLGPLSISLVEKLTGLPDNQFEQGWALIQSLPILNAYSGIEELYLNLTKKAAKFSD